MFKFDVSKINTTIEKTNIEMVNKRNLM